MLVAGLTSVTFRRFSYDEIAVIAKWSGLSCIEWGGDLHVPPGDIRRAKEVKALMADNGLKTASYGSYYRCGIDREKIAFEKILETALELNAPLIRVWAGGKGSGEISEEERKAVILDSRRAADLASRSGIKIGFEFHGGTLNDNAEATQELMKELSCPNAGTYWQAPPGMAFEQCCASLNKVLPWLLNIHVYHYRGRPPQRTLLEDGRESWRAFFEIAGKTAENHYALLEFVLNDNIFSFRKDAELLKMLAERQ